MNYVIKQLSLTVIKDEIFGSVRSFINLLALKLLLSLASSFFGSEIGLGILDLVIEARRVVVLSVLLEPPLAEKPEEGLSQQ